MATARKTSSKPAAKRVAKTSAGLKQEIEKTQRKLADLQTQAYAEELKELIGNTGIVDAYKTIKAEAGDATDVAILTAIVKAFGVARIEIVQTVAQKRVSNPRKKAE